MKDRSILSGLLDVYTEEELGVIINCGTRLSTTLAILSANKYLGMPILVVNCPLPNVASDMGYFIRLQKTADFDLIELPLRKHGETLDYIFSNIKAKYVCLIDSDVEILNDEAIKHMKLHAREDNVFGAGFTQGPALGIKAKRKGYYIERMYIPFTYLNVGYCREAIQNGVSFNIVIKYNDFPYHQRVSQLVYKYLTKYRLFDMVFNIFRKNYCGYKPSVIARDTGADIYSYLKGKGLIFIGYPRFIEYLYINHFDGITRNRLDPSDYTGKQLSSVESIIKQRLKELYNFDYDEFN